MSLRLMFAELHFYKYTKFWCIFFASEPIHLNSTDDNGLLPLPNRKKPFISHDYLKAPAI